MIVQVLDRVRVTTVLRVKVKVLDQMVTQCMLAIPEVERVQKNRGQTTTVGIVVMDIEAMVLMEVVTGEKLVREQETARLVRIQIINVVIVEIQIQIMVLMEIIVIGKLHIMKGIV